MDIYRFHSKTTDKCRVTVVGAYNNGYLNLAVARCSKKDQFNKKLGNIIAEGRLLKGKLHSSVKITDEQGIFGFLKHAKVVSEIVKCTKICY